MEGISACGVLEYVLFAVGWIHINISYFLNAYNSNRA
jgi:hypothetical protein